MHCEARFHAVGARTLRGSEELERATDRDMPGHGRPTRSGNATSRRFPAPHPHGPGRTPPEPRDRRKHAETTSRPQPQPRLSREKPASRRQLPQARQRPARRPSSSPGTPPPLRYPPAPPQAPGRQTTRRRQAGPSTGRRRAQDRCIPTPPATAIRSRPPQPASASHRQTRRAASFRIGLDHGGPGISTDSARGPEATGNNRHVSYNTDTRTGRPTPEPGGPPSVQRTRKSQVRLPDVQPGDRAADNHALDLAGALEDGEDLRAGAESSVYPITSLTCGNVGSQGFPIASADGDTHARSDRRREFPGGKGGGHRPGPFLS